MIADFAFAPPVAPAPTNGALRVRAATAADHDFLAAGLPEVTAFSHDTTPDGWMEAVADGSVTAVIYEDARGPRGFALVALYRAGRTERSLYLAAFYAVPGSTRDEQREAVAKLDAIAKANRCDRLTFNSTRPEWRRAARHYGFAPSPYVTYERRLNDGR